VLENARAPFTHAGCGRLIILKGGLFSFPARGQPRSRAPLPRYASFIRVCPRSSARWRSPHDLRLVHVLVSDEHLPSLVHQHGLSIFFYRKSAGYHPC